MSGTVANYQPNGEQKVIYWQLELIIYQSVSLAQSFFFVVVAWFYG
jgi:hypothetical protein